MVRADYLGRALCIFACLLALMLIVPLTSYSQQVAVAQVSGQLTDPSGAAVPDAAVKLIETNRGVPHDTTSNGDGRYVLPGLPVGPYRLEVSKTGFKTYVQSGIVLQVNDHITLNVTMQLGAVTESVVVSAGATMVQNETTDVSNVVDSSRISDLPLNGRYASQLIILSGAANMYQNANPTSGYGDLTGSKSFYSSFALSVAGGQYNGTNYLLDGGDNNDTYAFVNLPFPFPDALQEFSVETSSLPARTGTKAGGVVNVVTKSGTNSLHGDLFEFFRDGGFNARAHPYQGGPVPGTTLAANCFQPSGVTSGSSPGAVTGNPCDILHRHVFGGTAGGKLIKDKVFWFMGYQGTRIQQVNSTTTHLPTQDEVANGDLEPFFNPTAAATGVSGQPNYWAENSTAAANCAGLKQATSKLLSPYFGSATSAATTGLTGNSDILQSGYAFDPAALKILNTYGVHSVGYVPYAPGTGLGASATNPCGFLQYTVPQIQHEDQVIGRIDWSISPKHQLYGRYFIDDFNQPDSNSILQNNNLLLTASAGVFQRAQTFTLGDTYSLTPTTINSFHFTWTRRRDNRLTLIPNSLTAYGVNTYTEDTGFMLISGPFSVGCGTCNYGHFNVNSWQAADDVDIIRGKHHISFGVDFIRSQVNTLTNYDNDMTVGFGSTFTNNSLGDFLMGLPSGYSMSRPQQAAYRESFPAIYLQDVIHVTRSLTVNAGLRWEPLLFPYDVQGRGTAFSLQGFLENQRSPSYAAQCTSAALAVDPNACPPAGMTFFGDPGQGKAFSANKLLNISPRIGIAWNPGGSQRQVLRIGAGIFYDATELWWSQRETSNPPTVDEIDTTQSNTSAASNKFCGTLSNPWEDWTVAGGCVGNASQIFGTPVNPSSYKGPFPSIHDFPANALWVVIPQHVQPLYVAEWNVSYQFQFAHNWVFNASYIGNKSTHVPLAYSINFSETPYENYGQPNLCAFASPTTIGGATPICTTGNEPQRAYLNVLAGGTAGACASLTCNVTTNSGYNEMSTGMEMASTDSNGNYNGLLVSVQHRLSQNYSWLANYTYSKCLNEGQEQGDLNGATWFVNQIDRTLDYGPCAWDIRHMFNTSLVATSPFKVKGFKGWILGGWEIAPNIRVVSGLPFSIGQGDNLLAGGGSSNDNPFLSYAPGCNASGAYVNTIETNYQYLSQTCFSETVNTASNNATPTTVNPAYAVATICTVSPCTGQTVLVPANQKMSNGTVTISGPGGSGVLGNISRNALYAPGAINIDLAIMRNFPLHWESMVFQVRLDMFNLLNHWNPQAPNTGSLTSGTVGSSFGYITGAPGAGILPTQYDPRVLQIAGKISW